MRDGVHCIYVIYMPEKSWWICVDQDNLLMLALSNFRRKLFDLQTFQNQAHIISVTGIIIYFLGTYYLYTPPPGGGGPNIYSLFLGTSQTVS